MLKNYIVWKKHKENIPNHNTGYEIVSTKIESKDILKVGLLLKKPLHLLKRHFACVIFIMI